MTIEGGREKEREREIGERERGGCKYGQDEQPDMLTHMTEVRVSLTLYVGYVRYR